MAQMTPELPPKDSPSSMHLRLVQLYIIWGYLGLFGLFWALFLVQSGQNTPKLCTVALALNIYYLGDPFGAILASIWPFGAYLEAQ